MNFYTSFYVNFLYVNSRNMYLIGMRKFAVVFLNMYLWWVLCSFYWFILWLLCQKWRNKRAYIYVCVCVLQIVLSFTQWFEINNILQKIACVSILVVIKRKMWYQVTPLGIKLLFYKFLSEMLWITPIFVKCHLRSAMKHIRDIPLATTVWAILEWRKLRNVGNWVIIPYSRIRKKNVISACIKITHLLIWLLLISEIYSTQRATII